MRSVRLLFLFAAIRVFAADGGPCPPAWGYGAENGPDRWGQLETEWAACDAGVAQSPVILPVQIPQSQLPTLTLQYVNGPLVVQHTGTDLKVPTARGTLTYGNVTAQLQQFHIHAPSEHLIAGAPNALPGEIHFVHEAPNKQIYVVAVFYDGLTATPNAAMQRIIDLKPAAACSSRRTTVSFNPQTLIPPNGTAAFWTYGGSLTTPACAEGVTFFVLRDRLPITVAQITALSFLRNNRPPQGLGTRTVQKNF